MSIYNTNHNYRKLINDLSKECNIPKERLRKIFSYGNIAKLKKCDKKKLKYINNQLSEYIHLMDNHSIHLDNFVLDALLTKLNQVWEYSDNLDLAKIYYTFDTCTVYDKSSVIVDRIIDKEDNYQQLYNLIIKDYELLRELIYYTGDDLRYTHTDTLQAIIDVIYTNGLSKKTKIFEELKYITNLFLPTTRVSEAELCCSLKYLQKEYGGDKVEKIHHAKRMLLNELIPISSETNKDLCSLINKCSAINIDILVHIDTPDRAHTAVKLFENYPNTIGHHLEKIDEKYYPIILDNFNVSSNETQKIDSMSMTYILDAIMYTYDSINDVYKKSNSEERFEELFAFLTDFAIDMNPYYVHLAIDFLQTEDDIEIIAAKEKILEDLLEKELFKSDSIYSYLAFINHGLAYCNSEERIKLIKSRSKYFKEHSIEDIFPIKTENKNKTEKLEELVNMDFSSKRRKQNYKIVKNAGCYDEELLNKIVTQMENASTTKDVKEITKIVTNDGFLILPKEHQLEILEKLPGISNKNVEESYDVEVLDKKTLEENIDKNKGVFTLKDKKTGIKVQIKAKKQ